MDAILYAGLNNAAWTVILALAAAAGARWWRSLPAVGHALWLMVLLKLVTPSVLQFSLPRTDLRTRDARAPIAPLEPGGPAPTARPSVDLGPAVSERVTPRDGHPPEASHQGAVTGSPEAVATAGARASRDVGDSRARRPCPDWPFRGWWVRLRGGRWSG